MPLDLERFKQDPVYTFEGSVAQIRADVQEIRAVDRDAEETLTFWFYVLLAGIALIVAGIAIGVLASDYSIVGIVIGVMGGVTLLVALFQRWQIGHLDFDDRRYELLDGVLNLLNVDIPDDETLRLRLDLRTPEHDSKFTREGYAGRWQVKYYTDAWLQLEGRFLDGTKFRLQATDKFQSRGRWGGRRGNKWKTKTKCRYDFEVTLKPKPHKYPHKQTATADLQGALQLPQWCWLKFAQAREDALVLQVWTDADWQVPSEAKDQTSQFNGVDLVAMMFLSLYQPLNLAKAIDKAKPSVA